MSPRAAHLIASLGLTPHPEGGFYREVFRSSATVRPGDGRAERPGLTAIYFLLVEGGVSRWHRVASDEAWHVFEGAPLALLQAGPAFEHVTEHRLGPCGEGVRPLHVVPAGAWQAARTTGDHTLVGCTVGPGFDFMDFEMLDAHPTLAEVARQHPEAAPFV